jgi:hypothetical protein
MRDSSKHTHLNSSLLRVRHRGCTSNNCASGVGETQAVPGEAAGQLGLVVSMSLLARLRVRGRRSG